MKFLIVLCALLPIIYASQEWYASPSEGVQEVDEIAGELEPAAVGVNVVKREIPNSDIRVKSRVERAAPRVYTNVLWKSAFPEVDVDVVDVEN